MRISEAGSIAIHALVLIAGRDRGEKTTSAEIARIFGISRNHLSKVMQQLVKAGLLDSDRGPGGGFSLTKAPGRVALLDVYSVTEGSLSLNQCLLKKKFCFGEKCVMGGLLAKINKELYGYLKNTSLKDIAIKGKREKR
jgi:Rrf2 family protein